MNLWKKKKIKVTQSRVAAFQKSKCAHTGSIPWHHCWESFCIHRGPSSYTSKRKCIHQVGSGHPKGPHHLYPYLHRTREDFGSVTEHHITVDFLSEHWLHRFSALVQLLCFCYGQQHTPQKAGSRPAHIVKRCLQLPTGTIKKARMTNNTQICMCTVKLAVKGLLKAGHFTTLSYPI